MNEAWNELDYLNDQQAIQRPYRQVLVGGHNPLD